MIQSIIEILPTFYTDKAKFFMDTLNICLKNGGKVQEYIDVEPIKDIDSLIKELNQYLTYKDIDIFTKVINESLVESELEKGKICLIKNF